MANAKNVEQKALLVNEAAEKMANCKALIAFDYQGLPVTKFEELRRNVKKAGGEVVVLKNNISRRAVTVNGYAEFADKLAGPKALVFSENNIVEPAKALFDFTKANKKAVIAGGIVEGVVIDAQKVTELATLPSYETLLTQLAAGMLGTVSQLAVGLQQLVEQMEANN